MIRRLLRWFKKPRPETPTASIYFASPLADLIGEGRPISRLTPSLFACGDAAVVLRYAHDAEFRLLAERPFRKILVLLDDDFWAVGEGDGLPEHYRNRMVRYREGDLQTLLGLATHVVAPSQAIRDRISGKHVLDLQPARLHPLADLGHHRDPGRFDMIFPGTGSHGADFSFLAPVLAQFLRRHPDARLTTFLGRAAPDQLQGIANATNLDPFDWSAYQTFVKDHQFHVAVAPALDTLFNRGRSLTRLHDNAAFGAAGLYSRLPPFEGALIDETEGLLIENDSAAWGEKLEQLYADRLMTEQLAAGGQTLSMRLGDPARVRAFWMAELNIAAA